MHDQTGIPDRIHPDLEEFLKYWRSRKEARDIPARRNIDPQDIPHLLRGICILEINYDGEDIERVKFRLAGTQLYEMAGKELTGSYVDEVVPPDIYPEIATQFQWIVENRQPCFRRFQWRHGPLPKITYERVMAPIASDNDDCIQQLIGMHVISSNRNILKSPIATQIPVG